MRGDWKVSAVAGLEEMCRIDRLGQSSWVVEIEEAAKHLDPGSNPFPVPVVEPFDLEEVHRDAVACLGWIQRKIGPSRLAIIDQRELMRDHLDGNTARTEAMLASGAVTRARA